MSLVDYPLFSWVVVIHSLHVSSFLEAHHQEIILPVQSAFWYIVFAVALPFSYVLCSRQSGITMMHGTMNVKLAVSVKMITAHFLMQQSG